jgi:hypothetical protein
MTAIISYLYIGAVLMSLVVIKSADVDMSSTVNWIYPIIMPFIWPVFLIAALLK